MLPLTEIEKGHYGGFLVLRGISFQDLGNEFLIYGVELERDVGIIFGGIAVYLKGLACHSSCCGEGSPLGSYWYSRSLLETSTYSRKYFGGHVG